jgi:hypothetical protein
MDPRQRILAAIVAVALLAFIIDLVRRRKLKQEYSWLWIAAGVIIPLIGLNYGLLTWITEAIGAGFTSSTLFFFGILFVVALCLQFSVKISALEDRVKNLTQDAALRNVRAPEAEAPEKKKEEAA